VIYDNFSSDKLDNIAESLEELRCSINSFGVDVREIDILNKAMEGQLNFKYKYILEADFQELINWRIRMKIDKA
jgi:hypothetical protein